jgi:beta-lactamase class A/uncharacterized protein YraI
MSVPQLIRSLLLAVIVLIVFITVFAQPDVAHSQDGSPPAAFVEAIQEANVRVGPAISYDKIAAIVPGTTYPVVGRSAHFPWYLIQLPNNQQGWVYQDVVKLTGNINAVPFTEIIVSTIVPVPVPVSPTQPDPAQPASQDTAVGASVTATLLPATAMIPPTLPPGVYAEAINEANVRYGPGTDLPRIGTIKNGQKFQVLRRHSLFNDWVEIYYPHVASERGWVYKGTVTITGDLFSVPETSMRDFGYPTLTPTPAMVVTSVPPWAVTLSGAPNPALEKLSNEIYDYLLARNFVPGTQKSGSVFLMDLKTGQSFSLNSGVAYSAMSLIKIPILVSLYRKLDILPRKEQAQHIVEMMDCSENTATNTMIRLVGNGNAYSGAAYITETMQQLGLKNTFLLGPLDDGTKATPTDVPPQPISSPKTQADQTSAEPDPYSQSTPDDLGWLLSGIYQCAVDGSGPFSTTFPGAFTANECRQMVRTMRANKIGAMIEAGVPLDIPVAHKHGWIPDTHGDAGLVTTPGNDYVLSVMLYGKTWLNYDDSFPAIAEISRMTYNAYNPDRQLAETHTKSVPECTLASVDPQLLVDLQSPNLPPIR